MADDSVSDKKSDLSNQKSQRELLLEKIQLILEKTDPESWRKGGAPLNPNDRFEKPRQTWEEVYTLDIPAGTLVLRKSSPVKSDFVGRGFGLFPISVPNFTTEIRGKGWHHSELTDPYKRSRLADRTCNVLADGEIAAKLYKYLEESYKAYFYKRQREFEKEATDFVVKLSKRLKEETLNTWDGVEEVPGEVHYRSMQDSYEIDVSKKYVDNRERYDLHVSKRRLSSKVEDPGLAKELFLTVSDLGQTSRLATLTKALEQL